jgi:hypothetical protein
MEYRLQTLSLDRTSVVVMHPLPAELVERRVELAAQHLALAHLGTGLEGGAKVAIQAEWQGETGDTGVRLDGCDVRVTTADGQELVSETIAPATVFLLETQALIDALSLHHNIFRPGERAASFLVQEGSEPLAPMEFKYTAPEYDAAVTVSDATLAPRASTIIADLTTRNESAEQHAFALGVLGPGGVPLVTDIAVPPEPPEAQAATVDFTPEDWSFAREAVAELGPPFRILGPLHTHPAGAIRPSPEDWELFLWGGDAASLFIIAAMVGKRPVAVGYRWAGTLTQVKLDVQADESADAAAG